MDWRDAAAVPPFGSLVVARDRSQLRRRRSAKIDLDIVDVAPAPAFRRVVSLDDRVAGFVEMLPGMAMRRIVAAADMAAVPAQAEVKPGGADGEAFGTAPGARSDPPDSGLVMTWARHRRKLRICRAMLARHWTAFLVQNRRGARARARLAHRYGRKATGQQKY